MNNATVFDALDTRKKTIARRFSDARDYNHHASIQQQVCQILINQIADTQQSSVLEVGAGTGLMTRLLIANIRSEQWIINELAGKQLPILQAILPSAKVKIGDAEAINLGKNHSLIISANAVQWFNDPLSFIQQSYNCLQSGGQLLFNTFTPNNFLQIKKLTGQGLDYPAVDEWKLELEDSGFEQVKLSIHRFELPFDNPYDVLKHMQLTGVSTNQTATSSNDTPFIWTKTRLQHFESDYWQQFSGQDKNDQPCVNLTYEVLMINAFK